MAKGIVLPHATLYIVLEHLTSSRDQSSHWNGIELNCF